MKRSYIHYLHHWVLKALTQFPFLFPAGPRFVHHELLHVHLLGSVLRLPGRLSGQGVCSVRLRLGDPWGEENPFFFLFKPSWLHWRHLSFQTLTTNSLFRHGYFSFGFKIPGSVPFPSFSYWCIEPVRLAGYLISSPSFPSASRKSHTSCFPQKTDYWCSLWSLSSLIFSCPIHLLRVSDTRK